MKKRKIFVLLGWFIGFGCIILAIFLSIFKIIDFLGFSILFGIGTFLIIIATLVASYIGY